MPNPNQSQISGAQGSGVTAHAQRIYASGIMDANGDGTIKFPPVTAGKWALTFVSFTPILPGNADTWSIGTASGIILAANLPAVQTYFDFSSGLLFYGNEQITITITATYSSGTQVNAVAQIVPVL